MAEAALVSDFREELKSFLRSVAEEKGKFALAMLLQATDEPGSGWNLVLSATWIDRTAPSDAFKFISRCLSRSLSKDNALVLSRFSTIPTHHPFVKSIVKSVRIPWGEVTIENSSFGSVHIPRAIVFVSDPSATTPAPAAATR